MDRIVDLTERLDDKGHLVWDVPEGRWTVLRFGHTSTGATTRPAPLPGLGLECDKLDKAALDAHFQNFLGKLMADLGPLTGKSLTALHIDSWEMGPQNWTARFPDEFHKRRGYDLRPLSAGDDRTGGGQPGNLRALPLGPPPDGPGTDCREPRRAPCRAGPAHGSGSPSSRTTALPATT